MTTALRRIFSALPVLSAWLASASLLAAPAAAHAQEAWPARPLRLVVPFPPGGGTDIVARALGDTLAARLKQAVVVDNKPGASTLIGADAVAKAAGDGQTLLVSGSTTYTVNPALRARLPYDPARDLVPLALIARAPLTLVVPAASPWKNLNDLLAAARARPGEVSYASFGPGSGPQLAAGLLGLAAGVSWLEVPYKGSALALTDLIGGQVQVGIDTVAATAPHVKSGKLRALAIVGAARSPLLPGVPTVTELKLPEAVFDAWYAVAVPGRTDAELRKRIEGELRAAAAVPALQDTIRAQGMEPAFVGSDALKGLVDGEVARYRMLGHRARIVME